MRQPQAKAQATASRHTCASLLVDAGGSVVLVASRLGHADP
jgi:integrase